MDPTQHQHHRHAYHSFMGVPAAAGQRQQRCEEEEEDENTMRRNECAREANRVHCKETRDRKRERERLLAEVRSTTTTTVQQQWFVVQYKFKCTSFYHILSCQRIVLDEFDERTGRKNYRE